MNEAASPGDKRKPYCVSMCVRVPKCVRVCVCLVYVTLFFIPGSDSIRIPYGTKLSLYMSKDAEGTADSCRDACSANQNHS